MLPMYEKFKVPFDYFPESYDEFRRAFLEHMYGKMTKKDKQILEKELHLKYQTDFQSIKILPQYHHYPPPMKTHESKKTQTTNTCKLNLLLNKANHIKKPTKNTHVVTKFDHRNAPLKHQLQSALIIQKWWKRKATLVMEKCNQNTTTLSDDRKMSASDMKSEVDFFQVDLISARGLALMKNSTSSQPISAQITLLQKSGVVKQWQTDCQLPSACPVFSATFKYYIHEPVGIDLNDWQVIVTLQQQSTVNGNGFLGKVLIDMSLLEATFAIDKTLSQWFPLEKNFPGESVLGDVRLSIEYKSFQASDSPKLQKMPFGPNIVKRKYLKKKYDSARLKQKIQEKVKQQRSCEPVEKVVYDGPKHKYLKKKPYKVRFEKLDWSNVQPKTHSRQTVSKKNNACDISVESGQLNNEMDVSRLKELRSKMLSVCGIKRAQLARMKNSSEFNCIFSEAKDSVIPNLTKSSSYFKELQSKNIPDVLDVSLKSLENEYEDLSQRLLDLKDKLL